MTAITEDWQLVNDLAADRSPARDLHRRAVLMAVIACASEHDGKVHASWMHDLVQAWVDPRMIGNVMSQLSRAGIIGKTGRHLPSGQAKNRNSNHELPVRYVIDWARLNEEIKS